MPLAVGTEGVSVRLLMTGLMLGPARTRCTFAYPEYYNGTLGRPNMVMSTNVYDASTEVFSDTDLVVQWAGFTVTHSFETGHVTVTSSASGASVTSGSHARMDTAGQYLTYVFSNRGTYAYYGETLLAAFDVVAFSNTTEETFPVGSVSWGWSAYALGAYEVKAPEMHYVRDAGTTVYYVSPNFSLENPFTGRGRTQTPEYGKTTAAGSCVTALENTPAHPVFYEMQVYDYALRPLDVVNMAKGAECGT